jgi:transposase
MIIKIIFTDEQTAELKKEKEHNPFYYIRRRCEVVWLKSQGFKNKEIEKITGVTHGTVTNYLRIYRDSGISGLKTSNYKGQPSKLHAYTELIKDSLEKKPPGSVKEAKERIKEITGLELSLTQIKYFMDSLGFKRRKVKQIPDKTDAEKQEIFKKKNLIL